MYSLLLHLFLSLLPLVGYADPCSIPSKQGIRVATYNTSLNRKKTGEMYRELLSGQSEQASKIAQLIKTVDPDVLLVQELDKGTQQEVLTLLHDRYLKAGPATSGLSYPYRHHFLSNTGVKTGVDLDRNQKSNDPGDAQGFGWHPGQYGFALLSKLPFEQTRISEFRTLLWRDLPGTNMERIRWGEKPWYGAQASQLLRLSSKNHVAVPIQMPGGIVWLLAAHPTPPVFDGPEDRNGWRNFDEIRLLALLASRAPNLKNDRGEPFMIPVRDPFIIMGDLNADPKKGDGRSGAISQLLDHPKVNQKASLGDLVPEANHAGASHPRDTSAFGLRVDYIIPSSNVKVLQSGLCRKNKHEAKPPSDHFLVWMDIQPGQRKDQIKP